MAFQKYNGLNTTGSVDDDTAAAMTAATEQARATADAGTLVEIDKSKQLLFFVVDGRTQWIFNTSTANGQPYEEEDQNTPGEVQKGVAITPNGLHKVNRERPVGWWEGDLGRIYRPKYFVGRRRRARLQQRAQLPGVARLRPGDHPGDGLHLGDRHDADGHPRLGPRRVSRLGAQRPTAARLARSSVSPHKSPGTCPVTQND